jgi:hypothetical protein
MKVLLLSLLFAYVVGSRYPWVQRDDHREKVFFFFLSFLLFLLLFCLGLIAKKKLTTHPIS